MCAKFWKVEGGRTCQREPKGAALLLLCLLNRGFISFRRTHLLLILLLLLVFSVFAELTSCFSSCSFSSYSCSSPSFVAACFWCYVQCLCSNFPSRLIPPMGLERNLAAGNLDEMINRHIYIYREREREREKNVKREGNWERGWGREKPELLRPCLSTHSFLLHGHSSGRPKAASMRLYLYKFQPPEYM